MRYIDSGSRDPTHALGNWLNAELTPEVTELRIQSGFYSAEALAAFNATFGLLAAKDGLTRVIIGSNDGGTLKGHLEELTNAMGLPRDGAQLGVVYYAGAYFHPKTYHIRREDGSQAAYVGSANFTLAGIGAKHIEAGVIVDSREGDSTDLLAAVANATDAWFNTGRQGLEIVSGTQDVQRLLDEGIIRLTPPPRPARPAGKAGQPPQRPSLAPLIKFTKHASKQEFAAGGEIAYQPLPTVQQTPPYPPLSAVSTSVPDLRL